MEKDQGPDSLKNKSKQLKKRLVKEILF
jgi:hypothetical protein